MKSSDYKSRKFVMCYMLLIAATTLLGFEKIDATIWRDVVVLVFSAYVVGNVGQKWLSPDPAPQP